MGIQQNLSTAFHPQTDEILERANQWLKQYLQLITLHQEDWAQWLPLATAVHNNAQNATTKQVPNMILMGISPALTPETVQTLGVPATNDQMAQMVQAQKTAIDIINQPTSILRVNFTIGE